MYWQLLVQCASCEVSLVCAVIVHSQAEAHTHRRPKTRTQGGKEREGSERQRMKKERKHTARELISRFFARRPFARNKEPLLLLLSRVACGAKNTATMSSSPLKLLASPEEWLTHMGEINGGAKLRHRTRGRMVQLYLNQLAVLLTGTGLHCDMTEPAADVMGCLQGFRMGAMGHATFGISMAGLARMQSLRRMIETVAQSGLNGSYAETGVWRGGMTIFATAAMQLNGLASRPVYLCDSFRGLPLPRQGSLHARQDSVYHSQNKMLSVGVQMVLQNFGRYGIDTKQVMPIEGYFVDSMPKLRASLLSRGEKLAILRLDGDMYDSTVDVLYNLYDLVEVGGFVVIDDFSFSPKMGFGARDAIMDFRNMHGIEGDAAHAVRNIDDTGAWFRKAREVTLRRDLYEATLKSTEKNHRQKQLRAEGTVISGPEFQVTMDRWRASWTEEERKQADAVTKATSKVCCWL